MVTSSMSWPMPDFTSLKLVDTHAHISFSQFDHDRGRIIDQIEEDTISLLIEVGTNVEDSRRASDTVCGLKNAFFSAGVHPHDSSELDEQGVLTLEKLLSHPKAVALGEMGLDYFRNLSPVDAQINAFEIQLELASKLGKPVIIHVRDAYNEAYEIIKSTGYFNGVIHAFSGDLEFARKFVDLGLFLGIGGPVTYKKNDELRRVAREIPLERLLCETDCPYLPPVPLRGKRNEPYYVGYVIEEIAAQKNIPAVDCSVKLFENALELFSLKS
ncbi:MULTISPECIES: TatD family hydrolase [unclassified Mesotoga]|uniref:TatD family hydrolase n=1 Tax=unclassified Mesotoga TaxID=1184398 RepID=UPI000AFC1228|nr:MULTISPECIES: TatD family hydrolase [unclassified Mesotoga]